MRGRETEREREKERKIERKKRQRGRDRETKREVDRVNKCCEFAPPLPPPLSGTGSAPPPSRGPDPASPECSKVEYTLVKWLH